MSLFRRRRTTEPEATPEELRAWLPEEHGHREAPADPDAAARRFWRRWVALGPEISAALGDSEPQRFEHQLSEAVADLHPELHFAVELGGRAVYALVISGQEDPELRPYTDAWKAAAPAEDAIWEFHDSVPPVPDPTQVTINLGPVSIALADTRLAAQVDADDGVVDVAVHHPRMADLQEAARSAVTYLPLDAALGERLAARRLRRVETAVGEPEGTIGLLEFRDLVRDLDEPSGSDH
jgi:hypothetical protein